MSKRVLGIVMTAAFAIAAVGTPALADQGGDPNENACWGQAVSGWDGTAKNYGQSVKKDAQDRDRPGLTYPNVRAQYAGTNRSIAC